MAFIGIMFLALNLRAPFTSLAPMLSQIMDDLSLTGPTAGFLTALPLLSFALVSPWAAAISRRLGLYPSLLLAVLLIGMGVVLRSMGSIFPLYLGTIMIGAGIATGNVLLPVVVKLNFPARISIVTSLYIFIMGAGSTLSSSIMVPISKFDVTMLNGWQFALLFNLIFPVLALLLWIPEVIKGSRKGGVRTSESQKEVTTRQLLKCPVAWQVTLAIGLNSFTFYSLAGWLPTMLGDIGYSDTQAGYLYGLLQFATMIPGLVLLPFLSRSTSQRWLISICAVSVFVALVGLLSLSQYAVIWVVLFGFANCATFIIGMSFIGLRTTSAAQAATLSGLSQSIGYALAATGPSLVGYFYTSTGTWSTSLVFIAIVALFCALFANLAARDQKVLERQHS
ncbi:MFS transporter [Vibrio maritimus]|uniref:MFS transporter n=1 Tax=Vibrio maritimus TaxID=990268 RepID=UPI0037350072